MVGSVFVSSRLAKSAARLLSFAALLSFSIVSYGQSEIDEVGADAGSFSVNNSGSGAWSVAIEVPPGIRGMVPTVSVGVSTSSANGLLGQGGALSGLSSITRCTKNIASDGANSKLEINVGDQYCLDGRRLILISGTQGAANSEYRTEIDQFQRIIANGSAGSAGPESFTVTSRSGTQMTYGGWPASRINHNSGAVLNWRISQLQDTNGNYMDYAYTDSPTESLLYEINYGGNTNASQAHFLKLKLVYESRPDQFSGYQFGAIADSTLRLADIETYADNVLIRNYHLSYDLSEVSGQSRLSQFQECALGDDGEVCLAPTTFEFTPEDSTWQTSSIGIPAPIQGPEGQPYGLSTDINNDGWTDWIVAVRYSDGSASNQTWLGSASGFSSNTNWTLPAVLYDYQLHAEGIGSAQLIDINGDGYLDVIEAYQTTAGITKNVWLNSGSGFTSSSQFTLPDVFVSTANLARGETRLRLAELNGDGLVDAIIYTRDRNNTTTRKAWINSGTSWVEDAQWLPEQLLSDYADASYPGEREHATLADINGDGLADYIQAVYHDASTNNKHVWLNTGSGWVLDTDYAPPVELLDYDVHKRGHPKGRLLDLNGDGLLDIAHAVTQLGGSTISNAWLNTGEGWLSASDWALPASMTRNQTNGYTDMLGAMMDLNGDGKPEFVQSYKNTSNSTIFNAWEHNGSSWQSSSLTALPLPLYTHETSGGSSAYAQIADIDSDGIADVFTARTGISNTVHTHAQTTEGEIAGFLKSIRNGLDMETVIHYAHSNDPAVYTPASLTPWPNIASNGNRVLIQSSKVSDGLGGWNEAFHHYDSAKVNVTGRGSLGFTSHSAADGRSGIEITTEFYQDYPFTGMAKASSNKTAAGIVLASSSSTTEQRSLNGGKTVFAYVKSSTSDNYDLDSGSWIQQKQLSTTTDDYGNTIETTETITNAAGEQLTKIRTVTPILDLTNWILDKTGITTETISQPGKVSHTTTVNNSEYYANTNLLKTEILEPGDAHSLTSEYEYDVFGNRTKTTISTSTSQSPVIAPRVTSVNFTNSTGRKDGRFPISVSNTLGHTATSEYDGRYGKPTLTTDANGIEKVFYYNAFGVQLNETIVQPNAPALSGKEIAIPHWCTEHNDCPPNALYFIAALDNQREAPESAYFDAYGREIRRQTHGMGGEVIYQDTEYDTFGRKARVSNHYFKDQTATISWKETSYDILDRPVSVTMPDGGVSTLSYAGLTTSTANALGQTSSVTKNILGKAAQSTDPEGNSTSFTYDVRGNLLGTIDSAGNQIINTYDQFSRKLTMSDPDMGDWTYVYDAFGQMISQTDANGESVTMVYDAMGRVTSRNEREGQSSWVYDTATHGLGKLTSVSSPGYSRALEYDELGRANKSTVTTNGKNYVTEFGYQGVAEKVDWVQYPSGVVIHKKHDDYGFPLELQSIDLSAYQAYRDKFDEANNHYREALFLEEQYQDEYEALQAIVQPYYDRINAAQASAIPLQNLAQKAYGKYLEHFDLANLYATEYNNYTGPYNAHIASANNYISSQNNNIQLGDDAETVAIGHYWAGVGYEADADYHWDQYQQTGSQSSLDAYYSNANLAQSKYDIYSSQMDLANSYWAAANQDGQNAQNQMDQAASYEEGLSIYGATLQSHGNIRDDFLDRYEAYIDQSVPFWGRWAKREDAGSSCISWANDDPNSEYCVTELGDYQLEWNALAATGKEDRYLAILDEIKAEVDLGDAAKEEADSLETAYEDSTTVYWTAQDVSPNGQIKKALYGNGVETTWTYDEMGRVGTIGTVTPYTDTIQTSSQIQDELYDFDALGNLLSRNDLSNQFVETFEYDTLNRLTKSEVSGAGASLYAAVGLTTIDLTYDALGNITSKSDVGGPTGSYSYGQGAAGPHAVTYIGGTKNTSFTYDSNGNQLSGNGRTITYTSFNKPLHTSKAGNSSDMLYGPGRELVRQVEIDDGTTTTTTYIGGLYEELEKDGSTQAKHHLTIAGETVAVISHEVQGTPTNPSYAYEDTHYLHKDHLNSVTAITDQEGKLVDRFHYDAFGQRRTAIVAPFATLASAGIFPITARGYTGHKQMSGTDLVHMRGRVYDPEVGRFLSADPHIQSPLNTQSLNRYSYVGNNPLSYTDPSGYFLGKLIKKIKNIFDKVVKVIKKVVKAVVKVVRAVVKVIKKVVKVVKKYWKVIVAVAIVVVAPIAVNAVLPALSAGASALVAGAVGGGLAGLVTTGTVKGMLIGAISGAALAGIGNAWSTGGKIGVGRVTKLVNAGETTANTAKALKIAAHGFVGGARAVLSGGKFGAGFVSAGFTQAASGAIGQIQGAPGQLVAAGVAGGIGSELAGGDFEDGFVTGVFSHGFNELQHKSWGSKIEDWFKHAFPNFNKASNLMHDELTNGNIGTNDISDALRHANGMKNITKEIGPGTALMVGAGHELKNIVSDSQPLNVTLMDMSNNISGILSGITGIPIIPNNLSTIDPNVNAGYPSNIVGY